MNRVAEKASSPDASIRFKIFVVKSMEMILRLRQLFREALHGLVGIMAHHQWETLV